MPAKQKLSETEKVHLLETTVQTGTLKELQDVLETYQPFEMMARALGLAARYRGIDFVKILVKYGATFNYTIDPLFKRRYKVYDRTKFGIYLTHYYLMVATSDLITTHNSPVYGVGYLTISPELEVISLPERVAVAEYFKKKKKLGVSMDEMLFWAITHGDFEFADALIEMGVDLKKTPPNYYPYNYNKRKYFDILTKYRDCIYWNDYINAFAGLDAMQALQSLKRFHLLLDRAGGKLTITKNMFEKIAWNDESLLFILENADISQLSHKMLLECAISNSFIEAQKVMGDMGWSIKEKVKDEGPVKPNSVAAFKQKWNYKKLKDGTLQITGYKGNEMYVEVPSKIGRTAVTVIGDWAFYPESSRGEFSKYRKRIRTVIIPEGIKVIGKFAFADCTSLETVSFPKSLKRIEEFAFNNCKKLKNISLAKRTKIERAAFSGCTGVADKNGFIIINDTLYEYLWEIRSEERMIIPDGITRIAERAFWGYKRKIIILPQSVKKIEAEAFNKCNELQDLYIPATVTKIGENLFSNDMKDVCVHTPSGSMAEKHMKEFEEIRIVNDYE